MHPSVYYIILFVFLVHISKCWKKYFISYFILFSFFITTNNQLDCNILSLLPERKSLKIPSKLGYLTPGLGKMDESRPS